MRAKEFINENVPAAVTDTEREVAQAIYMEGRCGVLAIAINRANPERYKLGYIYEYNVPGTQDVYLDPDEFDALDPEEQQQVKLETQSWALVHAYVVDQQTKEYIDARGRHSKVPDLNYELNLTRKNVFPATSKDIVDITVDMKWNDATEEWDMVKGIAAWNQLGLDNDIPEALDYAVKYLNIDLSKGSQSAPKKSNWMNPGDPLPPSSPNSDWVILGPYKNVLYRFSAPNEQRASAMKNQWCKENNIDSDSNRFCRLKYDGEVRLGQPIKPQGVTEGWSQKYKKSINCSHPKGFSQRAHCAGKRKQNESVEMEMVCEDCGMCEAHADTDVNENLRDWFKDKWVRFGPDGKIRGDCARGSESEGKPKCLPQSKAHALGKKGRASAAARKRRQDPDANRSGKAINVSTKGKRK